MKKNRNKRYNYPWKLIGWDTFSSEEYSISEHKTQELAEKAAAEKMQYLEEIQPSKSSGGQGTYGIQDQVYIQRPDGTRYRWFTTSGTLAALTGVGRAALKEHPQIASGVNAQLNSALDALEDVAKRATKLRKKIERELKKRKK